MVAYNFKLSIKVPDKINAIAIAILLFARKVRYGYAFRRIRLPNGMYVKIDPEDYAEVSKRRWYAKRGPCAWYAVSCVRRGKRRHYLLMHRFIMKPGWGMVIDHINHDGLDNRRANLRIVTQQQNTWNSRRGLRQGKSIYKGVSWDRDNRKWAATMRIKGKCRRLGFFEDEIAAAKAYDAAAKKHRGEYALINFEKKKRKK